jgi:hypothetical protein
MPRPFLFVVAAPERESLSELPERLSDYPLSRAPAGAVPLGLSGASSRRKGRAHGQEGVRGPPRAAREAGPKLGSERYEVSDTATPLRLRALRLHQVGAEAAGCRIDPPKIFTRVEVEGAYCELRPDDVLRNPRRANM